MLPTALARAIRLPLLTPEQFTPTKWDDAPTKAKFGNHLLRFIAEDFRETMFTQKFYEHLMTTFGHIAHMNRAGFWGEFFLTRTTKIDFLDQTIRHPCYGDPAWTYSDVERVIRVRLQQSGVLDWHHRLLTQEREAAERATYERLARKYAPGRKGDGEGQGQGAEISSPAAPLSSPAVQVPEMTRRRAPAQADYLASPIAQPDLFAGL